MEEIRRIKWQRGAADFWTQVPDNSVELQFVVSYGSVSQTEKGFEDLVNTLNEPEIRNKIKKLIITDASYLYRHCIPEFATYSDSHTIWYKNNEATIKKLQVNTEFASWTNNIQTPKFREWFNKIKLDFDGCGDDSRIVRSFRDAVISDASVAAYKGEYNFNSCVDFLLEECAYTCAFLQNSTLLYPTEFLPCMANAIERYNTNITLLTYKTSKHAQKHTKYRDSKFNILDKEIALFMKEKVSNVNFFVIDKEGRHLYKNYALMNMVGDFNAKEVTPASWQNSLEVMRTQETHIFEETYKDKVFLSVKSPLIINGEVEGIIGLALDIADRKKLEQIERKKEVQNLAESVVHDIRTPLSVLSLLANHISLPEKKHIALKNVITSIETILEELLAKYKDTKDLNDDKEQYICVQVAVVETLRLMRYRYADSHVKFNFIPDVNAIKQSVFIKGNYSDFCRALSNLMNNAAESLNKGINGTVKIGIKSNDDNTVSVFVQDNGCGMPLEIVDKIMRRSAVQTTKENGHGLGIAQVTRTVDDMQGHLWVSSKENIGTDFRLTFPKSSFPEWFSDIIRVKKDGTIIILDDDRSIFDLWKDVFANTGLSVKYFTNGRDAVDFISSVDDKNKLFLIADYELRDQKFNGVDIINQSGMQAHSLIVTNIRLSEIKPIGVTCDELKIFPKLLGLDKLNVIVE